MTRELRPTPARKRPTTPDGIGQFREVQALVERHKAALATANALLDLILEKIQERDASKPGNGR